MKFIEDDFELEDIKKTYRATPAVKATPKSTFVSVAETILTWILALLVAYPLYRGGQYLIDLIRR